MYFLAITELFVTEIEIYILGSVFCTLFPFSPLVQRDMNEVIILVD